MIRRLTASLIPAVFLLVPVVTSGAAPPNRPAVPVASPATRPSAPSTRPAPPATRPVAVAPRPAAPRPATGAAGKAEPLPTQEDLQALFDAGDYTQVLQKMGRVLILKARRGQAVRPPRAASPQRRSAPAAEAVFPRGVGVRGRR